MAVAALGTVSLYEVSITLQKATITNAPPWVFCRQVVALGAESFTTVVHGLRALLLPLCPPFFPSLALLRSTEVVNMQLVLLFFSFSIRRDCNVPCFLWSPLTFCSGPSCDVVMSLFSLDGDKKRALESKQKKIEKDFSQKR